MAQPWAIAAVCVTERSNRPIYTACFYSRQPAAPLAAPSTQMTLFTSIDDELQLHFLMNAALDVCDEKVAARTPAPGEGSKGQASGMTDVRYLEVLQEDDRFRVHGFQSASGVRVLLVTVGDAPRDAVLPFSRSIYEAVSVAWCSPFRERTATLHQSRRFENEVQRILDGSTVSARSVQVS